MAKQKWGVWVTMGLAGMPGCLSGPQTANPLRVQPTMNQAVVENPLFVPQGYEGYGLVFDRTYDVLTDYFDIQYSNRYDGRIESFPLLTAGFLSAGKWLPSAYENLEATFQTVRRRAIVLITPADSGGYHIEVQVLKELEDLAEPVHAGKRTAVLQPGIPIGRRSDDVLIPEACSNGWIPIGRDCVLEQEILERIRKCL